MLCFNLSDIVITSVKSVDYHCITMTLANLKQFIYWKILYLMVMGIYKMHIKEINIKSRVCNYYFDNLIKAKKVETKKYFNQ